MVLCAVHKQGQILGPSLLPQLPEKVTEDFAVERLSCKVKVLESFLIGDGGDDAQVAIHGLLLVNEVTAVAVAVVARLVDSPGKEDFVEVDNLCAQFEMFSETIARL